MLGPDPGNLVREGLNVLFAVGAPLLGALLVVGFLVGIMQAATQINDPAVGFLPRLATGLLVVFFFGAWMVERLAKYVIVAMERIAAGGS